MSPAAEDDAHVPALSVARAWRDRLFARHPWLPFVLPLAVFMALSSFEPTPADTPATAVVADDWDREFGDDQATAALLPYSAYPWVYSCKLVLTMAAIVFVWPVYRSFPWRVSGLAIGVGAIGAVLWIALCHWQLERILLAPLGLDKWLGMGQRSAFNPLTELAGRPAFAWAFLAIRFVGLAIVVPIMEEFFLRGFVIRYAISDASNVWWKVPFGNVDRTAVVVGTLIPMAMHPGELFAAMVWFSLITWLMIRTRSMWDCVVAHGVTNFLLGVYVVAFDQWQLM